VVRGNCSKKLASRSGRYPRDGGSCQRIGPSFGPSASSPVAKKFATGVRGSFSFFMCVMNRGALTLKTKSSGVCAAQDAKSDGRFIE
jgi:hypothetical protein